LSTENNDNMKMTENWSFKKKFLLYFWGVITLGILLILLVFWMIIKGWIGYLPPTEELLNPKNHFATEVISSDLQHLGHYYRHENRVEVDFVDISPYMINALIATEDVRFYTHPGVDMKSLFRAVLKLGKAGGGSTLTQQLAKQLYSPTASNIW
jgi:penicillin-binding protein 1A